MIEDQYVSTGAVMRKLTLSAEEEVIAQAKELAARQGTSVSAMLSRRVRALGAGPGAGVKLGPITRRATGLVRLPADKTDRELVAEALAEKHGLGE